jgi:putative salt-induced outer membrane protein YdiY
MGKKFLCAVAAAALGVLTVSSAMADQVITTTGDTINGTIKGVTDGSMIVHTASMSDVSIPLAHIQTFTTSEPIVIQLEDGSRMTSQVASADAGNVTLISPDGGPAEQLSIAGINNINPQAFTASVTIGAILTRGNTFTDSVNAGLKLGYTWKKEELSLSAEYLYGKQKTVNTRPVTETTTTDRWEIEAKYQHFFTKKFYGYADVDVTKDRIALLAIRAVPSVGAGYDLFDKSPFKLGLEGGASYVYEEFTNGTTTQSEIALKLAYHTTYDITPTVQFFNDVTYYPVLAHISRGNFLLLTDIGLHAKLIDKVFAELKIEWDYDAVPANGALKNDERYIASLGYSL